MGVHIDFTQELVRGKFNNEIKNRFLCSVNIEGEDTICYIPSSCRLSNFLNMKDREVLLKPIKTPHSRTPYSVYAVKYGRSYILLNMAQANTVVEEQLFRRYFSFLGKRKSISHEVNIGRYKADLLIHDTNTVIEIKSLLAFDREAVFPTVNSDRAVNQLKEISRLLDEGYKACFMMVSLNPKVKKIVINSEIEAFYTAFIECVKKGMVCSGISIKLVDFQPEIIGGIQITY